MSKLPPIAGADIIDFLVSYSPELAEYIEELNNSDPERAAALKTGWQDDLNRYLADVVGPLYERAKKLNPARMHHDLDLWDEISGEAEASLKELLRVWREEVRKLSG